MDEVVAKTADSLYEADFYAWTQKQAALLRAGRIAQADIANILEEIEALGRKEVSELRSRLRVLAQHLLKEIYQPERAGRSWETTIGLQRDEIDLHLLDHPSLKAKTSEIYRRAYASARKLAAGETGLPLETFPEEPPFTVEQALDPSFRPARGNDRPTACDAGT